MTDVLLYMLPISGNMLLEDCFNRSDVSVKRVFIPQNFEDDCSEIISNLKKNDIPYRIPESLQSDSLREWVHEDSYDVGLSVGYDKKLPEWLTSYPDIGTINLHPSLLPDYRGANPYFWVIRNQEDRSGATLHYMDSGLDTGPIIDQRSIELTDNETMGTLFFELNSLGMEMFNDLLDEMSETGQEPASKRQSNQSDAPRAPEVMEPHLRIDWESTYQEIDALVRAGNPFYGAYTTFRGNKIRIFEVDSVDSPEVTGNDHSPADIHASKNGPIVRCDDGWVRLNLVQVGQKYKASGLVFQEREEAAFQVLDRVI